MCQRSTELIKRVAAHVTDARLVASLGDLGYAKSIGQWAGFWLARATAFWVSPPIEADAEGAFLHNAAVCDATQRCSNCLAGKTTSCATGRSVYAEHRPNPAIIEPVVPDRGFLLDRMDGRHAATPDPQTRAAIIRRLTAAGIRVVSRDAEAGRYNRLA